MRRYFDSRFGERGCARADRIGDGLFAVRVLRATQPSGFKRKIQREPNAACRSRHGACFRLLIGYLISREQSIGVLFRERQPAAPAGKEIPTAVEGHLIDDGEVLAK
jgi:hypothetical protein